MLTRHLKHLAEQIFAKLGYLVIPAWRKGTYEQADYLRRLFDYGQVECVIDVGANMGQFHDFLRLEVGFTGWIVSFEPVPKLGRVLQVRALTEPRWIVEISALGAVPREAKFKVMADTQFSSFLEPDHSAVALFNKTNRVVEELPVRVSTLDDALEPHLPMIGGLKTYLKLDTQGFDLEVLKGAEKTLTRVVAAQSEASVKPIYRGMPDYHETIRSFQDRGYELSGLYPNNAGHFPLLVEFDCHVVSRALLDRASTTASVNTPSIR